MDMVWNDYSIDGQFDSLEDFLEYLVDDILEVFKTLKEHKFNILKSYNTYNNKITKDISLYNLLYSIKQFGGFPEITELKSILVELTDAPFWNDDIKTDSTSVYRTDVTEEFHGSEPNCFSEALERDGLTLSFKHALFEEKDYQITKNSVFYSIHNIRNTFDLTDILADLNQITLSEMLSIYGKKESIVFLKNDSGKYYADDSVNDNLSIEDKTLIKDDFLIFLKGKKTRQMPRNLTDTIIYKDVSINEFRTKISDNTQFRIFYYIKDSKYIFLRSLIKKTQGTPEYVKRQNYDIIRQKLR